MFDAFISHASRDYDTVAELVEFLEAQQLKCWLAPRNIPAAAHYGAEIVKGIEQSQVLVLVLTEHSNHSGAVAKEVERAFSKGKKIIPLRLQDITPSEDLEFYISSCQWIDCYDKSARQQAWLQLAEQIKQLPQGAQSEMPLTNKPLHSIKPNHKPWLIAAVAAILAVVLVGILLKSGGHSEADQPSNQSDSTERISDEHIWLSQGQKQLRKLIMQADLAGLEKFLAVEGNKALLIQTENEFGLPLLLDMIRLNPQGIKQVIEFLITNGHFDPNHQFEAYSNMPMEGDYYFWPVQQTYMLNLPTVFDRLGSFKAWQQHIKQKFGYKLPDEWQQVYQQAKFPSDIEKLYNASSGKVIYTAQLFSYLANNQAVLAVFNKQPKIAASKMLLSNGVEIPLSLDNWQWLTQAQMPDKNWYLIEQQEKTVQ